MRQNNFRRAAELHAKGELEGAIAIYESIYNENKFVDAALVMNYGSALRKNGDVKKAIQILKSGLNKWSDNTGLWLNLGNAQVANSEYYNGCYSLRKVIEFKDNKQARLSLYGALQKANLKHLAYKMAYRNYVSFSDDEQIESIYPLLESIIALPQEQRGDLTKIQELIKKIESDTPNESTINKINRAIILTQTWANLGKKDFAWTWYCIAQEQIAKQLIANKIMKPGFKSTWHTFSWNIAIHFIKMGEFKLGWKLYEHGLQVPAEGPQKWQRSLKKPFHNKEVPLWKGESISGKNLLILGEQGIGDTMMFATLLPKLAHKGGKLFFIPGHRLEKTYKRNFDYCKIISADEAKELNKSGTKFDYQVPVGSLPQYHSSNFRDFESAKLLTADETLIKNLREKYLNQRISKKGRVIGISWQGGGKESRIPLKSISLEKISDLVSNYQNDIFVSLQYGNDKPHLDRLYKKTGKKIYHDDTIDPLKDMDSWLAQVAAVDLVISIANTTIHGAGGLGVKTLCLVSNKSDWRWMNTDIYRGCYWYQSVETTYQDPNGSWDAALKAANEWLA